MSILLVISTETFLLAMRDSMTIFFTFEALNLRDSLTYWIFFTVVLLFDHSKVAGVLNLVFSLKTSANTESKGIDVFLLGPYLLFTQIQPFVPSLIA